MFFVFLCPGAPEGSTSSGSDFKASQKTGPRLKVSSSRLGDCFVAVILGYTGGLMVLCFLDVQELPEGSTCSGSGFKPYQKTRPRLKVSSDRLGDLQPLVYKTKNVAFLGINQFRWDGLRFVCWFYDGNT